MQLARVPAYTGAQICGGLIGTAVAAFDVWVAAIFELSSARSGLSQVFGEFVATFGLMTVIWGCSRLRANAVPFAVGSYITAAYWFTSSTSFANPAVTVARAFSDTFSGIRPGDAPAFIAAQLAGAIAATFLFRWLVPSLPRTAEDILMPHGSQHVKTYLFACVHNAGRSQIAAALFNVYADQSQCRGISAGTEPASHVHAEVVETMREIGIDLGSSKPQKLTSALAQAASVLVTMGCGDACPFVPGLKTIDWPLPDPKGKSVVEVRAIRDEIHERVKTLIRSECADCIADSVTVK